MNLSQAKDLITYQINHKKSQTFLIEAPYKGGQKQLAQTIIGTYMKSQISDMIWISKAEDKGSIGLSDIQPIKNQIQNSPLYGEYSIIVIDDADFLNKQAQNALLKVIEEPGKHSIILILGTYHQLLPTIYSRCLSIYLDLDKPSGLALGHRDIHEEITTDEAKYTHLLGLWDSYISLLKGEKIEIFQYIKSLTQISLEEILFVWESIHWLILLAQTDKPRYNDISLPNTVKADIELFAVKKSNTWTYKTLYDLSELKKTLLFSNRKSILALEQFLLDNHPHI